MPLAAHSVKTISNSGLAVEDSSGFTAIPAVAANALTFGANAASFFFILNGTAGPLDAVFTPSATAQQKAAGVSVDTKTISIPANKILIFRTYEGLAGLNGLIQVHASATGLKVCAFN